MMYAAVLLKRCVHGRPSAGDGLKSDRSGKDEGSR